MYRRKSKNSQKFYQQNFKTDHLDRSPEENPLKINKKRKLTLYKRIKKYTEQ